MVESISVKISAFAPDKIADPDLYIKALSRLIDSKSVPDVRSMLNQTIQGWSSDVHFSVKRFASKDSFGAYLYPSGTDWEIWTLVSKGARPHPIVARRVPNLRFQAGYVRATKPGVLKSVSPRSFGEWRITPSVDHPGFEGREFAQIVKEEYQRTFERDVRNTIEKTRKVDILRIKQLQSD